MPGAQGAAGAIEGVPVQQFGFRAVVHLNQQGGQAARQCKGLGMVVTKAAAASLERPAIQGLRL